MLRNKILQVTRCLGRSIWEKWVGYHARSRVEAQMNRLKRFGERIMSRDSDPAIMNRCSALGKAEIEAIA